MNNKNSYAILPLEIIYSEEYKNLSADAIFLYMLLLNRHSLSLKKAEQFRDEQGVFIYYTIEQITSDLRCSPKLAVKLLDELEEYKLIERKRQYLCKPSKIYVKKDFSFAKENKSKKYFRDDLSFDIEKAQSKKVDFGTMKNEKRKTI